MWSLTTLTGLFYSLNQHYIAPASRPRSRAEEPVEPVPPERGPGRGAGGAGGAGAAGERAGAAGPPEQAGAGRCRRSRPGGPGSRAAGRLQKKKKKKDLTNDLIACISGDVARGSALLATRRPIYAIKFGFSLTT